MLADKTPLEQNGIFFSASESIQHQRTSDEPPDAKKQRQEIPSQMIPANAQLSLVDPIWQEIDPTPDVFALFDTFNKQFFNGSLSSVEVRWSSRMTLCAGMCVYEGRGQLCSVRLSEALLKFRPRSDLVETLLHEMIHAYLFISENNRDREGHGPSFKFHMKRINKAAKTNITVYHNFHDEVENYKVHWWHCNGPCAKQPPFFGLVRRAMNRAPGPNDLWWREHQSMCNGQFIKIKEPDKYANKKKRKKQPSFQIDAKPEETRENKQDLRNFFPQKEDKTCNPEITPSTSQENGIPPAPPQLPSSVVPFSGTGRVLGGSNLKESSLLTGASKINANTKIFRDVNQVACPVCSSKFSLALINIHLDTCLS